MPPDLPLPPDSRSAATSVPALAIGLMSGTSQDGVDVALIETDGEVIARFGPTAYRTYSKKERALLRSATAAAANITDRTVRPAALAAAEAVVNAAHAEAVETFFAGNGIKPGRRDGRRLPRPNRAAPAAAAPHGSARRRTGPRCAAGHSSGV
jgi:1,6-anhydro-N-acetylmuramate kinase